MARDSPSMKTRPASGTDWPSHHSWNRGDPRSKPISSRFDRHSHRAIDVQPSTPILELRPDLLQGQFEAPAIKHIKVLGGHGIGMINMIMIHCLAGVFNSWLNSHGLGGTLGV